jgi:hypothetical protein
MKESRAVVSTATVPGSLLSQYKLLRAVIDAPWATRLDHKIASHIINLYWAKHGNARASLRYLENATGATRPNIIESLRRIAEQGVINVARQGVGTRPTEYGLNFAFADCKKPFSKNKKPGGHAASGSVDDTSNSIRGIPDDTSNEAPSGIVGDTSTSGIVHDTPSGIADDTSSGSSGIVGNTESYLRNVLTSTLTVSRNEDTPAGPTAPPVSGLEAHTAVTAVDPEKVGTTDLPIGFQELWTVWPRKHHIAKARAAYKALAPDPTLHATLVTKATQWAVHYEQTATEKRWWKHLHAWLAEERYLEDPPEPYENPKEAAIARKRESGPRKASKHETAGKSGLSSGTPIGRHKVSITDFDMTGSSFDQEREFIVSFKIEDGEHGGKAFSHAFNFVSSDENTQTAGQALYASIRHATGILEPDDTSDFIGKPLLAVVKPMGRIEYAAE